MKTKEQKQIEHLQKQLKFEREKYNKASVSAEIELEDLRKRVMKLSVEQVDGLIAQEKVIMELKSKKDFRPEAETLWRIVDDINAVTQATFNPHNTNTGNPIAEYVQRKRGLIGLIFMQRWNDPSDPTLRTPEEEEKRRKESENMLRMVTKGINTD